MFLLRIQGWLLLIERKYKIFKDSLGIIMHSLFSQKSSEQWLKLAFEKHYNLYLYETPILIYCQYSWGTVQILFCLKLESWSDFSSLLKLKSCFIWFSRFYAIYIIPLGNPLGIWYWGRHEEYTKEKSKCGRQNISVQLMDIFSKIEE